jgi:hypothetical protein
LIEELWIEYWVYCTVVQLVTIIHISLSYTDSCPQLLCSVTASNDARSSDYSSCPTSLAIISHHTILLGRCLQPLLLSSLSSYVPAWTEFQLQLSILEWLRLVGSCDKLLLVFASTVIPRCSSLGTHARVPKWGLLLDSLGGGRCRYIGATFVAP